MDCSIPVIPISFMVRNALVREGLRHVLVDHDFHVSKSIAHIEELILVDRNAEHILIYEGYHLPSSDDLHEVEMLAAACPGVRIVLLADTFDFDCMSRAFLAGVYGYIVQDVSVECFVSMIRLVMFGQKVVPSELIDVLSRISKPLMTSGNMAHTYCLAEREVEILDCLTKGMPNKLISRTLGVSEATVKLRVKGIFRKMSVTNRTQAAIMARAAATPS